MLFSVQVPSDSRCSRLYIPSFDITTRDIRTTQPLLDRLIITAASPDLLLDKPSRAIQSIYTPKHKQTSVRKWKAPILSLPSWFVLSRELPCLRRTMLTTRCSIGHFNHNLSCVYLSPPTFVDLTPEVPSTAPRCVHDCRMRRRSAHQHLPDSARVSASRHVVDSTPPSALNPHTLFVLRLGKIPTWACPRILPRICLLRTPQAIARQRSGAGEGGGSILREHPDWRSGTIWDRRIAVHTKGHSRAQE